MKKHFLKGGDYHSEVRPSWELFDGVGWLGMAWDGLGWLGYLVYCNMMGIIIGMIWGAVYNG